VLQSDQHQLLTNVNNFTIICKDTKKWAEKNTPIRKSKSQYCMQKLEDSAIKTADTRHMLGVNYSVHWKHEKVAVCQSGLLQKTLKSMRGKFVEVLINVCMALREKVMKTENQNVYQFTLILKNINESTSGLEDSLYKAGCDDALINYRNGTVYLDFDRESISFKSAVISAIKNVEASSVKAKVASVAPEDLVSEAEVADRLNKPRQTISLWIQGKRRSQYTFPVPVMKLASRSPLWRWHEIVAWLFKQKIISERKIVEDAEFIENINVVLEERDNKNILSERKKLLAELETYSLE